MKAFKIIFDYFLAVILLIILWIPSLFIYLILSIDTQKSGLFHQQRIGENKTPFTFFKFRTIKGIPQSSVTHQSMNISKIGKWIRQSKLDEIPQLINVLKGDMSFVGPRPDVPEMMKLVDKDDEIIFSVKPGITGPAQLKYKNEEQIINLHSNPEQYYKDIILPDKIKINKEYVQNWSIKKDFYYLYKTVFK